MKKIIYNENEFSVDDISIVETRVKALIINNDYFMYLGNEEGDLQFPGGHREEGEFLNESLIREVKEELGIILDIEEIDEPFLKIAYIFNEDDIIKSSEIYYYIVHTNKPINLAETNYTDVEINNNFSIENISLNNVMSYVTKSRNNSPKSKIISPDMITALEEFFKIN